MSLLAWDSYDYIDTDHLVDYYEQVEAGSTVVSGGRCGTNCLRIASAPAFKGVVKGIAATTDTLVIAAAIKRISGSNPAAIWQTYSGSTPTHRIFLNNDGSLEGTLNPDAAFPTLAWTSPGGIFGSNTFRHLQIKIKLHATLGRVQIRVDGSNIDDYDSGVIPTIFAADPAICTGLMFNAAQFASGSLVYYDDFWCLDTAVLDVNNPMDDFLGDLRVEALEPTANGATTQWTLGAGASNALAVDDGGTPDDDTTYIEDTVVGHIDTNVTEDSALPPGGTIFAVGVKILAKKDQPGNRTVAPVSRQGGVDYVGNDLAVVQDEYFYCADKWEINPATGLAWTVTDVNDSEFGVKLTA